VYYCGLTVYNKRICYFVMLCYSSVICRGNANGRPWLHDGRRRKRTGHR